MLAELCLQRAIALVSAAKGKIEKSGTGLGKCIGVETVGRYTYYVIQIGKTEATAPGVGG